MNNHYNKSLKAFARKMRKHPTRAERRLWYDLLSNKKLGGVKFLRQRPIDNYIVDFFCKELKLIVEVDGITHDSETAVVRDVKRDKRLEDLGYRVVRISNWEVLNDLALVQKLIVREILSINPLQFASIVDDNEVEFVSIKV